MTVFSPRWSSFGLLCACSLAGLLGFYGRDFFQAGPGSITGQKIRPSPRRAGFPADGEKTSAAAGLPEDRGDELPARAATFARDGELSAAIEKLAEENPLRAIEQARRQANRRRRAQLLDAAFRGWGKTGAPAAAEWILSQPADALDRGPAVASMLKGAVQDPDSAVNLTRWLNQQVPDQAREFGDALIYALAQSGDFERAAGFASGADGRYRVEWLTAAYSSWADYQPERAAAGAMAMADAGAQDEALSAVISSWGQNDPKGLADFAISALPEGARRTQALSHALVFWADENPLAAADWINRLGPLSELDSGRAAIATQQNVMKEPSIALGWAQSILDPNFRSKTVAAVVETWALSNPSGALNFLRTSGDITPEDRTDLLSKLAN